MSTFAISRKGTTVVFTTGAVAPPIPPANPLGLTYMVWEWSLPSGTTRNLSIAIVNAIGDGLVLYTTVTQSQWETALGALELIADNEEAYRNTLSDIHQGRIYLPNWAPWYATWTNVGTNYSITIEESQGNAVPAQISISHNNQQLYIPVSWYTPPTIATEWEKVNSMRVSAVGNQNNSKSLDVVIVGVKGSQSYIYCVFAVNTSDWMFLVKESAFFNNQGNTYTLDYAEPSTYGSSDILLWSDQEMFVTYDPDVFNIRFS